MPSRGIRRLLAEGDVDPAALRTDGGLYRLDLPADVVVDLDEVVELERTSDAALGAGRLDHARVAAERLHAIAAQPLLADGAAPWIDRAAGGLRDADLRAHDLLASVAVARGDTADAVRWAEAALELEPYRETAFVRLMEAHEAAGERAEALRAYERCRARLAADLGVRPSASTEALHLALLGAAPDETGEHDAAPAPPSGTVTFVAVAESWHDEVDPAATAWTDRHDTHLAEIGRRHHGMLTLVPDGEGGRVRALAFDRATRAVGAAFELAIGTSPGLRVAVHTGDAFATGGNYVGAAVAALPDLLDLATIGVPVLSDVTAGIVAALPAHTHLEDRGRRRGRRSGRDLGVFGLRGGPAVGGADAPPVVRGPTNLPRIPKVLIGREVEVDAVTAAMTRHRLVTIVGPGGVGKSHVAQAAGERLRTRHRDGVFVAEMGPAVDAAGAIDRIHASLPDVAARAVTATAIGDALAPWDGVIVLDECEHLTAELLDVVTVLLDAAPHLRLLVTSRQPLGHDHEELVRLDPLTVGDGGSSGAIELFLARAIEADPTFHLAVPDDHQHVAELCRLAEGVPLVIELIAVRLRTLDLALLVEIARDELSALTTSQPAATRVLATLHAMVAGLPAGERSLLQTLSVIRGAFTLDEAAEVAGATVASTALTLDALVERSLVQRARVGDASRYLMLGLINAVATEGLAGTDDGDAVRDRRTAALTTTIAAHARALDHCDHWAAIVDRLADIVAAARWSATRAPRAVADLLIPIAPLLLDRNVASVVDPARAAADRMGSSPADSSVRGRLLLLAHRLTATYDTTLSDLDTVDALAHVGSDPSLQARAFLAGQGRCTTWTATRKPSPPRGPRSTMRGTRWDWGALSEALNGVAAISLDYSSVDEAVVAARRARDGRVLSAALAIQVRNMGMRGDGVRAHAHAIIDEGLTLSRRTGDIGAELDFLSQRAVLSRFAGNYDEATVWTEEVVIRARATGARYAARVGLRALGQIALMRGDVQGAREGYEGAAALHGSASASGDRWERAWRCLIDAFADQPDRAAHLLAELQEERGQTDHPLDVLLIDLAAAATSAARDEWAAVDAHLGKRVDDYDDGFEAHLALLHSAATGDRTRLAGAVGSLRKGYGDDPGHDLVAVEAAIAVGSGPGPSARLDWWAAVDRERARLRIRRLPLHARVFSRSAVTADATTLTRRRPMARMVRTTPPSGPRRSP